jgi:hypothetical protein
MSDTITNGATGPASAATTVASDAIGTAAANGTADTAEPVASAATTTTAAASATHDRAREGLDHLQAAAHELIAAARAALDVAEELIDDPEAIASVVSAAGSRSSFGPLGELVRSLLPTRRTAAPDGAFDLADDETSSIQRIHVS